MSKNESRLKVISNIENAIKDKDFNRKVEEGDPVVTEADREKYILNFDILRKKRTNRESAKIAAAFADMATKQENADTEIIGLENIKDLETGIITSNHFNKVDSTIVRHVLHKIKSKKKLYIIIQEANILNDGQVGFLFKNCYTIPVSTNYDYMIKNFTPSVEQIFKNNDFILIYPEQEMWFNYRRPRPMKIGAYHYACKYNVPIIPCFVEIRNKEEIDEEGFAKLKYVMHVMKPIYPDLTKSFKERKYDMQKKDYELKVAKYEEVYGRKHDAPFCVEDDIAGWVEEEQEA